MPGSNIGVEHRTVGLMNCRSQLSYSPLLEPIIVATAYRESLFQRLHNNSPCNYLSTKYTDLGTERANVSQLSIPLPFPV